MKPSLQLQVSAQLTMTPQLQHAIKLLQMNHYELSQEIEAHLEKNVMLEAEEPEYESKIWPVHTPKSSSSDIDFNRIDAKQDGLQAHLKWQLMLSSLTAEDIQIGEVIIDSINEDGYLGCALDDLPITDKTAASAMHQFIMHLDPIGAGARNLAECLSQQVDELYAEHPLYDTLHTLINEHLEGLAKGLHKQICKSLKISVDTLKELMNIIQTLHPKPGLLYPTAPTEYVIPDASIIKRHGRWDVVLNNEQLPRLRVNESYSALIKARSQSPDNQYLRSQLQEAKWLIKSLENRESTLFRVLKSICQRQESFFEEGDLGIKPLTLADIAEELELHESTISRITNHKYVYTPHGIRELKFFFSTSLSGPCETSATSIRARIKKLVESEDGQKPLSDNDIVNVLKLEGIKVARRTVAKYREAMKIPPSSQRKKVL